MNGIEFNEENEFHIRSRKYLSHYDGTKMERFLIDKGIVKNEKQANYFLRGLAVFLIFAFFVSIYFLVLEHPAESVVAPDGTEYTLEEYIDLVAQDKDPLEEINN